MALDKDLKSAARGRSLSPMMMMVVVWSSLCPTIYLSGMSVQKEAQKGQAGSVDPGLE